jgi:dynein heavy chain
MRVFHDRLISEQDREYFKDTLASFFPRFGFKDPQEVLEQERILFCDFLANRDADIRPYIQVTGELQMFVQKMEAFLEEYNSDIGAGGSKK